MTVALAALKTAYENRENGITFGGALSPSPTLDGHLTADIVLSEPASADLMAHADATWGARNIYGLLLMYAGAAVLAQTKKIAMLMDSSMETEVVASSKGGEVISYAREILRALGVPPVGPTLITTDNLANQRVGSGIGCPTRSIHFLRRYFSLKQRIASGEVDLRHIPDKEMPADYLTKWIPKEKFDLSLSYAQNLRARPA